MVFFSKNQRIWELDTFVSRISFIMAIRFFCKSWTIFQMGGGSALAADWIDVALGLSPLRIAFMHWNACSAELCEIPKTFNSLG